MEKKRKQLRIFEIWRRLKKNRLAVVAFFILILLILTAVFAPLRAPRSYSQQNAKLANAPPSARHPLGNDRLGRDILSRLIYGARQSLQMGIIAVAIAATIGIALGTVAGFYGSWVDNLSIACSISTRQYPCSCFAFHWRRYGAKPA